ncbi:hypothetical protein A8O14_03805 [Polynucleobacter wuianus]|uniref:Uncharacterized protein n=1 Tax=Polynucleobacter wuianus TaxID=1743168 RepID=A0A191UEH4_9BURK|nr:MULTISPECIES: hypothetical protein [Polynucleobacter]ANI99296.1 hypothetical protein A8O14_03805 [Polynucleobacter wuianus]MBU3552108.1 hypothetical protein [Polynucleobacter sp. MWH-Post4-6-1]MBU3609547.1 hypothetical protein [Polynucleobacter wuianus]
MGDYDDGNNSGGIIGTIISILILAAIWPYLLTIIGLCIAYMAAMAVLEWMAQNPFTVVLIVLGIAFFYAIFHYRLIPKAWRWMIEQLKPQAVELNLRQHDLADRKFIPSTNLYCYWCTKKLGIKAWEKSGKYYCDDCHTKQLVDP